MLFLIDTNVVSDLMAEQPKVTAMVKAATSGDRVCTCAIVRGEVLYGISRLPAGKKRDSLQARAEEILGSIICQPISVNAADHYSTIKRKMEARGKSMAENDLWIAAAAIDLGATLVTRDRDFRDIVELTSLDWAG